MSATDNDRVADLVERLIDDPTEDGLAAALSADPGARDAVVGYLEARFVRGEPGLDELEGEDIFWRLLAIAASTWTREQRERFVRGTLFSALAPDAYRWLAPIAKTVLPPEEAEREVLAVIERGDEKARVNASHLAYHLFTGEPEYALSEIGQRRLADADPLGAAVER